MTHSDYIWIAIRIFGIYLVIQVVVSLVVLVSIITSLVAMLPFDDAFTFTRSNMVARIFSSLVRILLYALFARYFLTDGRRVYSWVDLRLPTELRGASTS